MAIVLKTVGIIVQDMDKSLSFYRELGLNIPAEADGENNFDFETENGIVLGFLTSATAKQSDPQYVEPSGSSLNLQFECSTSQEVDEAFLRLTGAGFKGYAQPWDAFWGQRFARVVDPDGRVVNIYAQL